MSLFDLFFVRRMTWSVYLEERLCWLLEDPEIFKMTWCILNLGGEFFCSLSKMRKCGKLRSQICQFVEEGDTFGRNAEYCINFLFDCDSPGVVYLIKCKTCSKIYVGSTITSFRKRFNNHKSSANRFAISKPGE